MGKGTNMLNDDGRDRELTRNAHGRPRPVRPLTGGLSKNGAVQESEEPARAGHSTSLFYFVLGAAYELCKREQERRWPEDKEGAAGFGAAADCLGDVIRLLVEEGKP